MFFSIFRSSSPRRLGSQTLYFVWLGLGFEGRVGVRVSIRGRGGVRIRGRGGVRIGFRLGGNCFRTMSDFFFFTCVIYIFQEIYSVAL